MVQSEQVAANIKKDTSNTKKRVSNTKKHTLDKYIVFSITVILIYTVTAILFQAITGNELSATVTVGVYGFFGTEIGSAAFIKKYKLKEGEL